MSQQKQPGLRYKPTQVEMHEQAIKELSSRVQSLEDAMKQVQSTVFADAQDVAAPLGICLDDVAPPPWLQAPAPFKKAKLLLPGMGRQIGASKLVSADISYAPLMKLVLPRAHRAIKRLLNGSQNEQYGQSFESARVFDIKAACSNRCVEVRLLPHISPPNDRTTSFELIAPRGGELKFTVLDDRITKIEMTDFAAVTRDLLLQDELPDWFESVLC